MQLSAMLTRKRYERKDRLFTLHKRTGKEIKQIPTRNTKEDGQGSPNQTNVSVTLQSVADCSMPSPAILVFEVADACHDNSCGRMMSGRDEPATSRWCICECSWNPPGMSCRKRRAPLLIGKLVNLALLHTLYAVPELIRLEAGCQDSIMSNLSAVAKHP